MESQTLHTMYVIFLVMLQGKLDIDQQNSVYAAEFVIIPPPPVLGAVQQILLEAGGFLERHVERLQSQRQGGRLGLAGDHPNRVLLRHHARGRRWQLAPDRVHPDRDAQQIQRLFHHEPGLHRLPDVHR